MVGFYVSDALLIIGLPDGPTAHFKLSKLVLRKDIKVHAQCSISSFLLLPDMQTYFEQFLSWQLTECLGFVNFC